VRAGRVSAGTISTVPASSPGWTRALSRHGHVFDSSISLFRSKPFASPENPIATAEPAETLSFSTIA
jgi:hypothetical protein